MPVNVEFFGTFDARIREYFLVGTLERAFRNRPLPPVCEQLPAFYLVGKGQIFSRIKSVALFGGDRRPKFGDPAVKNARFLVHHIPALFLFFFRL